MRKRLICNRSFDLEGKDNGSFDRILVNLSNKL